MFPSVTSKEEMHTILFGFALFFRFLGQLYLADKKATGTKQGDFSLPEHKDLDLLAGELLGAENNKTANKS